MGRVGLDHGVLFEREDELAKLESAVGRAFQGEGALILITGPAGIGKTRLLRCGADLARNAGFHVLSARGLELEQELAFGVVRQLLEPELIATSSNDRAELMVGAAELSAQVFAAGPFEMPAVQAERTHGLLHGLYWL